jgi:hypothetical protein
MADHFYGVSIGVGVDPNSAAGGTGVTFGTSTAGTAIELRVTDGAGVSKMDLLKALEVIEYYVAQSDAPA